MLSVHWRLAQEVLEVTYTKSNIAVFTAELYMDIARYKKCLPSESLFHQLLTGYIVSVLIFFNSEVQVIIRMGAYPIKGTAQLKD